jgi:hypothetical protein
VRRAHFVHDALEALYALEEQLIVRWVHDVQTSYGWETWLRTTRFLTRAIFASGYCSVDGESDRRETRVGRLGRAVDGD